MSTKEQIYVIGGGIAGYVCAIRSAQLGKPVTVIEEAELGGTCLNRGCIPTKVLLHSAGLYQQIKKASQFGLEISEVHVNFARIQERKLQVVQKLRQGVESLMKRHHIEVLRGHVSFRDANILEFRDVAGDIKELPFSKVVIAAGARTAYPPIKGLNPQEVMDSAAALEMASLPEDVLIIGAGVIGVEFASAWIALGTKVYLVEQMPTLLPGEDPEITALLAKELKKQGVSIEVNTTIEKISKENDKFCCELTENGTRKTLVVKNVLVATGRVPNTAELALDRAGVQLQGKGIIVNEQFQTNVSHIYAIGDVTGGVQLAHVAFAQGMKMAEIINGTYSNSGGRYIPRCIYTLPEIAAVGYSEKQAKELGYEVQSGSFPFVANGKAKIESAEEGFVKVISEKHYGQVLGVSIIGPHATELIAQAVTAIEMEATIDDLEAIVVAHPTLSEAYHEAVLNTTHKAIHV